MNNDRIYLAFASSNSGVTAIVAKMVDNSGVVKSIFKGRDPGICVPLNSELPEISDLKQEFAAWHDKYAGERNPGAEVVFMTPTVGKQFDDDFFTVQNGITSIMPTGGTVADLFGMVASHGRFDGEFDGSLQSIVRAMQIVQ